ncbi:MAG: hypothetical protein RSD49_20615, partial [Hafnia sp.]
MRNADRKIRLVMLLSPTLGPVALVQVDEDNGNIVSVGNADIRQTDALKDIYLAHRRRSVCSSPSFHQDKVVTISREHGSEV